MTLDTIISGVQTRTSVFSFLSLRKLRALQFILYVIQEAHMVTVICL